MYFFISDVHLGYEMRDKDMLREDLLLTFLKKIKQECSTLFIIGDLFDFWFEYKTVIPKYFYRTLSALKDYTDSGIEVVYLMGNHDFGHQDFFESELRIHVIKDDLERTIENKKFYLSHGDGKSHNDAGYRILKKILRSKTCQWLYFKLHPDIGIKLASNSSKSSRNYTQNKHYGKTEGMEEFAEQKIHEGFDFVVMGHRHRVVMETRGNGVYINLGDWLKNYTFGTFDGYEFKILNVKEFLDNEK